MVRILLCLLVLSGCVHRIELTNAQVCAADDMALAGIDHGVSTSIASGSGGWAASSATAKNINCMKPSPAEQCEVDANKASFMPAAKWNASVTSRNVVIGCGLALFVVPGLAVAYYFDELEMQARQDSKAAHRRQLEQCTPKESVAH